MNARRSRGIVVLLASLAVVSMGAVGCSAGDPQITAKASFFSDEITGAGGKYVQALPADEDKLGADICRIFETTGSDSVAELSWRRAVEYLVARGYSEAEARRLMADGTAAYCPAKSAAATALAKSAASASPPVTGTS